MSIFRALLVLAVMSPACAETVSAQTTAFTVPYGSGAGEVGRAPAADTATEYAGPSSLRAGANGELLLADPVNHRVLRLSVAGAVVGSVTYPAADAHDAATVGVDAAVDRSGNVCVLELASRSILRFGADGKQLPAWPVPIAEGTSAILNALAADSAGNLMVFDGFDNRALRFDAAGKATPTPAGLVQSLTMDRAGRFLTLDLPDGSSARSITLAHVDAATGKKEEPAAIALAEPANQFHLLGTDDAGRSYIEVTFGAVEKPDRRTVLVVSAAGKLLEGIPVPNPPTAFQMISSRIVLPAGGFLSATDTAKGLEIRAHALSAK